MRNAKMIHDYIENLFKYLETENVISNTANVLTIIVGVSTIISLLKKIIYTYKLRQLAVTKRPDWLSEGEFYNHTHNYIKTRIVSSTGKKYSFKKFINNILIKNNKQYHLILGESGTGKSTFLINIYANFECRKFKKGYLIKCISLRMPNAIEQICKIENQKQVILLLDAFDEALEANINAINFLNKIEDNTKCFAKVIITSRNNFFDNDEMVPDDINITRVLQLDKEQYNRYYIQLFTITDVMLYIIKKYKLLIWKIIKSLMVIIKCKEVVCRPLILSYIDFLIKDVTYYRYTSDIYQQIIENWIKREAFFICSQNPDKENAVIEEQLFTLINNVAIFMYKNYPHQHDYYVKIEDLKKFTNNYLIELSVGKRNRSLFDRINDKLVFAHKSLLEYLLLINFEKLSFRFEPHLNILYSFIKEMSDADINFRYSALFHANYAEYLSGISIIQYTSTSLIFESTISFTSRKYISDMAFWYHNAILLPLIKDKIIYDRTRITFKVNNFTIYQMDKKERNDEELVKRIMQEIRRNLYSGDIQYITITTFCKIRSIDFYS